MHRLNQWSRSFAATLAALMTSAVAFAQTQQPSGSTDVTTTTTSTTSYIWYTQWWVWAAGIAVFLIVVIALTNRGGRSNT